MNLKRGVANYLATPFSIITVDKISRSSFYFIEYPTDIFAKNAHAKKNHSTKEQHGHHYSGIAGYGISINHCCNKYVNKVYECHN